MTTVQVSQAAHDLLAEIRSRMDAEGLHEVSVLDLPGDAVKQLLSKGLLEQNSFHGSVAPSALAREATVEPALDGRVRGFVEQHGPNAISGWCVYEDPLRRHEPVRVGLYWGDTLLRTSLTNRERPDVTRGQKSHDLPGFWFGVRDTFINLLPKTHLSIRTIGDDPHEVPFLPERKFPKLGKATDGGAELREKLDAGWHVDHWGAMKVPFRVDERRRKWYSDAIVNTVDLFAHRYGKVLFPMYGTLLGYLREGKFLDHDDDVDTAYIARGHSIEEVAAEFHEIAADLIAEGHTVDVVAPGQLNVKMKDSPLPGVDVFAAWVKPDGQFYCYPASGGTLREPLRFKRVELEGNTFTVPADTERFVEFCYGPSWRIPDPGYQMIADKSLRAVMAALAALKAPR